MSTVMDLIVTTSSFFIQLELPMSVLPNLAFEAAVDDCAFRGMDNIRQICLVCVLPPNILCPHR